MAEVVLSRKSCSMNPLKSSAPLGAALAFLGIEGSVPLFHGAQGCTSLALVLAVRHFKETIPIQTTALNELATVLGGAGSLEEGLLNIQKRMQPRFIGIASTALVETRGEDLAGELRVIRARQTALADTALVYASVPDYDGGLEDGWSKAVSATIETLTPTGAAPAPSVPQINLLPGFHLTAADIEELVETVEAFGLRATVLPDLSCSLDGTVPESWVPTSLGGTPLAAVRGLGGAVHTIAVGEHMRAPARLLSARTGVPATVFPALTGLETCDAFVRLLSGLSGRPAPARLRRQRSRLVDAMLDGHFHFGGRRIALAADPDLLCGLAGFFATMGAEIVAAVASTAHSPGLAECPGDRVIVGDLDDFEQAAAAGEADLLVTHSHGRQAAERLGLPLLRVGFPIFDRLGPAHSRRVGYRGTRDLLFETANTLLAAAHGHAAESRPVPAHHDREDRCRAHATFAAH